MVISHNVPALFTHLSMRRADRGLQQAMTRLSSGVRINSAREDAAGLAIANKLNYQVGGLRRASENSTHGISLIQTAEGALNEVHNMLQRIRELSVQAAHGTLTNENRDMIQLEIHQLTQEIHSISRNTEFNRMRILNGEASRVTETYQRDPLTGETIDRVRSVVTPLLVDRVPPGRLDYTIVSVGTPAFMPINLPVSGTEVPDELHGAFTINGNVITVNRGEDWGDVLNRLNDQLLFAGMHVVSGETQSFLVTNLAGRNQQINIGGNTALLTALGLVPGAQAVGTDAVVRVDGLVDVNGRPVPGSESLGASTDGNQVLIRGAFGEEIRMNIQVRLDPDADPTPAFVFGDGSEAPAILYEGHVPDEASMSMVIREHGPIMLQIGPSHNTAMPVQIPRLNAETLGLVEYVAGVQRMLIDVRPTAVLTPGGGVRQVGAERVIDVADAAIQTVSSVRARLGAYQNRLESTVRNLDVAAENTEISRSRIQDTDMARETTRFAQYNVMFQAAMSLLGQANQRPQQIIQLLQ